MKRIPMLGGWNINDISPCNLPQRVASAFTGALEGFLGASYEPLLYVGSQVVNGMNYAVIAKETTPTAGGSYEHIALIVVNEKAGIIADGEKKYSVVDITTIL